MRRCEMYYFAYGSNLSRQQMAQRCPDSRPLFRATLPNYKLIFTGWTRKWRGGTASIQPSPGEKVLGAVYDLSERDLRRLDICEGYPDTYNRIKVAIFTEDGDRVEAMTYIKRELLPEAGPSPGYLAVIQQGYKDWGIV